MSDPEYGIGADGNARGLLIYHAMGMGKTRLAVAVAMALWDVRPVVVMLARSLQANFRETVLEVIGILNAGAPPEEIARLRAEAAAKFIFVSMDAYNSADQMARAGTGAKRVKRGDLTGATGGLDGKLLIIDEAHNFFRAIINSSAENANARRVYDMVMTARNLRLVFLTGTPAAKDPFELVPCFNMLAGADLLPAQYEIFYKLYVDRAAHKVRNPERLANRLVGLVSHVTPLRPSEPAGTRAGPAPKKARDDGWFPEERPTVVERVEMGVDQYRQYLLAREKEEAEGKTGEGAGGKGAGVMSTPALALPGSEKKAMRSYFVKSRTLSTFCPPREWMGASVDAMPDDVFTALIAPKLALVAERADKAPGPVLAYSQFVDAGGLKPLGRFLQRLGYAPYVPVLPPKEKKAKAQRAAEDDIESIIPAIVSTGVESSPNQLGGGNVATDTFSVDGRRFYDTEKTWALMGDAPVELVETSRIAWMLDEPQWGSEKAELSAREVLANPLAHPEHIERIQKADLSYPILVVTTPPQSGAHRNEVDFVLADGMHRLARAVRDDVPTVHIQRIPPDVLEAVFLFEIDDNGVEIDDNGVEPVETSPAGRFDAGGHSYDWRTLGLPDLLAQPAEFQQSLTRLIQTHRGGEGHLRDLAQLASESPPGEDTRILVVTEGADEVAAMARVAILTDGRGYVSMVHTAAAHRGRGLCKRGLRVLFDAASSPREYYLEVAADNAAAIACYAGVGFEDAGPDPDNEEERVMVRPGSFRLAERARLGGAAIREGPEARSAGPKGYYAIISGEVPSEARTAIKEAFNTPANAHGAVIKAILVSKTGAEGLDLKWLRETHQIEPYWDKARDHQVTARAVRIGSHDGLPEAEREVQPYLYIATANQKIYQQMLPRDREPKSIDELFYERANERYETNAAFRALLTRVCFECELFGYGACRVCVPTNAPLFHDDPALDIRLPDPCEVRRESDVEAAPLEVDGVTYYYKADASEPLGYVFYVYREDLGGYAVVDPSDPVVPALLRALG
jgi:RimJ/RimL family protein N-acetyltransferase